MKKRKLLIVVGAGASIDFGMPSVPVVGDLLRTAAQSEFSLRADRTSNLYRYIEQQIAEYWRAHVPPHLGKTPQFEDVLYAIFGLATAFPSGRYTSALGALIGLRALPELANPIGSRTQVDGHLVSHLGGAMVDALLDEFRKRCRTLTTDRPEQLRTASAFFAALSEQFEIAVATLNYDDIVFRSFPETETGFDPETGRFEETRILLRSTWPCFLHLHGSVHFDMREGAGLHDIHWNEDLDGSFQQNAWGRSGLSSPEGAEFPMSSIVAGYGKTTQILRRPFRTYYGELDRLAVGCDAVLFMGYGFGDIHLNMAFERFRNGRRRPAVVIDYAPDSAMTAGWIEWNEMHQTVTSAMGVLETRQKSMRWLGHETPGTVAELKKLKAFELSSDPDTPLAIWYDGMLGACEHPERVLDMLR
ncbi:SIR2 family protein [Xanthobacter autotrophicus]|uniref:SIR2 family protein n=1 Tax=Xanthobacter TaxID=279 RepID=UPI0024AC2081|nr:SIR2 family protein [Xanthobacter autotrophicus]MDI4665028.1 SIR2 family protein [Xanthobacter autotrophicus]